MVRLGSGGLDGKALTGEAMAAALQAFSRFRRLAESHSVEEILAAATSAVREAENGGEFLAAVERETGINVAGHFGDRGSPAHSSRGGVRRRCRRRVGGRGRHRRRQRRDHSRLGNLAARCQELQAGRHQADRTLRSRPIPCRGATSGSSSATSTRKCRSTCTRSAPPDIDRVIGTSGTILSLGTMAAADRRRTSDEIRNLRVPAKQIHRLRKIITERSIADRMKLPGLDPRRADLIVSGAVLLDRILRHLEASEITLCDFALREGLVLDYIQRNRKHIAQAGAISRRPPPQRDRAGRTLQLLAGARVPGRAAVAVGVRSDAGRARADRSRARMARVRGAAARHRHPHQLPAASQTFVLLDQEWRSAGVRARRGRDRSRSLRGITASRRRRRSHADFGALGGRRRKVVRTLAGILRFAETLDRSHAQVVDRRARSTIAARNISSSFARRAMPSSSSGPPIGSRAARARVGKTHPPERRQSVIC